MKVQPSTPHASITPRLNRASEAAAEALATKQGRKLLKDELKAAADAALQLTPVVEPTAPTLPQQATDFVEPASRVWMPAHRRPRPGSGQPRSKTAVVGLLATSRRLVAYAKARGTVLRVESLDLTFYQDFLTDVLNELGQDMNTFGMHIDRPKTLFTWCEEDKDLPVHHH
ncbi:MAG: hypothetical protein EOO56_00815 [Hymenobacter sp.]|nr:MAG: hypothetical protein EOO56_00815 [Hymenobacter sp.]